MLATKNKYHFIHPEYARNRVIDFDIDRIGDSVGKSVGSNRFDTNYRLIFVSILLHSLFFIYITKIFQKKNLIQKEKRKNFKQKKFFKNRKKQANIKKKENAKKK